MADQNGGTGYDRVLYNRIRDLQATLRRALTFRGLLGSRDTSAIRPSGSDQKKFVITCSVVFLQLLSQSPLSQVPSFRPRAMAGRAASGIARCSIFSRGVHVASRVGSLALAT